METVFQVICVGCFDHDANHTVAYVKSMSEVKPIIRLFCKQIFGDKDFSIIESKPQTFRVDNVHANKIDNRHLSFYVVMHHIGIINNDYLQKSIEWDYDYIED